MAGTPLEPEQLTQLVSDLGERGYAVAPALIAIPLVRRLFQRLRAHEEAGALERAAIGRQRDATVEDRVRLVEAVWLDRDALADRELLDVAELIRRAINRQLFLGLFEFEAQYLSYPPGGFYDRHIDSLAGSRNRIVSFVLYLNEDWRPEHGGELDLWADPTAAGAPVATIEPRAGTVVLMLSEEIPHQVRVAAAHRRVVAGWFRVNASTTERVDPAR